MSEPNKFLRRLEWSSLDQNKLSRFLSGEYDDYDFNNLISNQSFDWIQDLISITQCLRNNWDLDILPLDNNLYHGKHIPFIDV